jgi:hypothetical protein
MKFMGVGELQHPPPRQVGGDKIDSRRSPPPPPPPQPSHWIRPCQQGSTVGLVPDLEATSMRRAAIRQFLWMLRLSAIASLPQGEASM